MWSRRQEGDTLSGRFDPAGTEHSRQAKKTRSRKLFQKTGLVLKEWDDIKPGDATTAAAQFITEEVRLNRDG